MKNILPVLIALLLPCQLLADEAGDHFESRIRPLLKKACFECHQAMRKGGLRLDSRQDMLTGGKSGPVIVPGDPDKSLLFQAVARTHPRLKMPPGEPLETRQVEDLALGAIDAGADDVETDSGSIEAYAPIGKLESVREALHSKGATIHSSGLEMVAKTSTPAARAARAVAIRRAWSVCVCKWSVV